MCRYLWTAVPGLSWKPIPVGQSPFDKLDPKEIPAAERFDWQPKELVGVIGSHARRHWGYVVAAAISPDGKLAATMSASNSGSLIVWDIATRTPKWTLMDGMFRHGSLTFTADGKRLICLSYGFLTTYDLTANEPKPTTFALGDKPDERNGEWHYATLCEGGRTLVVHGGNDDRLTLFDISVGKPRLGDVKPVAKHARRLLAVAVTGGVDHLAYAAPDGKLHRATIKNAKFVTDEELPIKLGEKEYPRAITRDGRLLALRGGDHLQLWDLTQKPAKPPLRIPDDGGTAAHPYGQCFFSPDGRWLAAKYTHTALFRIDGPEPKLAGWLDQTPPGDDGSVAFSEDGNRAVVGNSEGFVRFWDLSGPEPKELSPFDPDTAFKQHPNWNNTRLDGPGGHLMLPRYLPVGQHQLWNLGGPRPTPTPGPNVFLNTSGGITLPVAGNRWLVGGADGRPYQLFKLADGQWRPVSEPFGKGHGIVSGDGTKFYLVVDDQPAFRLEAWDLKAAVPSRTWSVELPDILRSGNWWTRFCCSPDGRWITTPRQRGKDGPVELVLWRNTGPKPEVAATLPVKNDANLYSACFSPDGRFLAHTADGWHIITLVDLSGKEPKETGRFEGDGVGYVHSLAYHPGGKLLACGSSFGVGVLDVATGKPVWQWKAPGGVPWVEWAHDGRHLVTHNGNKTVYVLRLSDLGK